MNSAFLFAIEPAAERTTAATAEASSQYAARLALVLGNGANWDYRGECLELAWPTGVCSCGHRGLRFLFTLHHKHEERRAIVGSSCVETYADISPALVKRLKEDAARLEAAAADREHRAAIAAQSSEVLALVRQWSATEYAIDTAVADWHYCNPRARWQPPAVFRRTGAAERLADRREGRAHPFCTVPALVTTSGQAKRLRKYLAAARAELAAVQTASDEAPAAAAFAL